jgi:phage baseplate assembly protein W
MKMDNNNKPSILGKSLQLISGDLIVSNNDFVMVADQNNFLQAMQIMIETPLGNDIFNINYGFDLLGSISQPSVLGRIKDVIRLNIVKSLSQDNRVQEIREVVFDDEPRYFELNLDQEPEEHRRIRKTERRWQVVVILKTISDGEVALKLEGVGL